MKYNKHINYKNIQKKYRALAFLFLFVFLSACATSIPKIPITPPIESEAQSLWNRFIAEKNMTTAMQPYALGGSLRFGYTNKTHRVTYLLWSNGKLPLRLDIQASIGINIAKIEETEKTFLVYLPQEKKAIMTKGGSNISAFLALGMPMPLSFLDLSYLLRGDFSHAFGGINLKKIDLNQGTFVEEKYTFHFENQEIFGSIRLNTLALPVECNINNEWNIFVEYDKNNTPYKVRLNSLIEDYKAILLVKDNKKTNPYSEEQLKFTLPQGTTIISK